MPNELIDASGRPSKSADYFAHDRTHFLDWLGGRFVRVLDVGCGQGANADWYRRHGARDIVGVELDAQSAAQAVAAFDLVISEPIEQAIARLHGAFDLIVCADVLEHLDDPWSVVRGLSAVSDPTTVLAVSMPNIQFVGALARIAFGPGFQYQEEGIFDKTHLRFFTRRDMDRMLAQSGWAPERWGARRFGRLLPLRRTLGRISGGRSDQWLAEQLYIAARPAPQIPSAAT